MSDAADLFADDPPVRDPFAPPPAAAKPRTEAVTLDPDRVYYVPTPPNRWKAAALILLGVVGGSVGASAVWGVAMIAVVSSNGGFMSAYSGGDMMMEDEWDAFATDDLAVLFAADPVISERLGTVTDVTLDENRSYAMDAEWNEYWYDVTGTNAAGEPTSGSVRLRFLTDETFEEADLTLPSGMVLNLDLSGAVETD